MLDVVFCSIAIAGDSPVIELNVRLLHQLQELAGVGGQALDVAALAVGVDGIERERALSRPGEAGDDREPIARQIEIDRLQIVLARTANAR